MFNITCRVLNVCVASRKSVAAELYVLVPYRCTFTKPPSCNSIVSLLQQIFIVVFVNVFVTIMLSNDELLNIVVYFFYEYIRCVGLIT